MRLMHDDNRLHDNRSLGQLFSDLRNDATCLVRQEVELAKAELKDSARKVAKDTAIIAGGAILLLLAAIALTGFMAVGFAVLYDLFCPDWLAIILGPLTTAILLGLVGAVMIKTGRDKLQRERLSPAQTKASMKENKEWIRDKIA